jgi:hypothetical protein
VHPQSHRGRQVDAFFRHPMTLLVAGFLLTGVIGTLISNLKQRSDNAAAAYAAQAEHFRTSLDLYESNLSAWEVRASNIDAAIANQLPPDETQRAMEEYDKAYISVYGSTEQLNRAATQFIPDKDSHSRDRLYNFLAIGVLGMISFDRSIVMSNDCLQSMYLKTKTLATTYEGTCSYVSNVSGEITANGRDFKYKEINWHHQEIQALIKKTSQCGKEVIKAFRPSESFNSSVLDSSDDHAFDTVKEACAVK